MSPGGGDRSGQFLPTLVKSTDRVLGVPIPDAIAVELAVSYFQTATRLLDLVIAIQRRRGTFVTVCSLD